MEQIVADLLKELEDTSAGVSKNRALIEGTKTSIEILVEAMKAHAEAAMAINTALRDIRQRLAKLEAAIIKEKPPVV